ncbi:WD40 repeat domain-containing protein [Candidatus Solincola tengchongensis]|uniref:WD40 repeat domain-containing protein n=1 Tax=Candidatus Solincola tengchongensis TaxID=2900693 RepID=UPI002579CFEB|nr:WD40 repeat domain-containing protein [Candidatus Solincola tengchongensis]
MSEWSIRLKRVAEIAGILLMGAFSLFLLFFALLKPSLQKHDFFTGLFTLFAFFMMILSIVSASHGRALSTFNLSFLSFFFLSFAMAKSAPEVRSPWVIIMIFFFLGFLGIGAAMERGEERRLLLENEYVEAAREGLRVSIVGVSFIFLLLAVYWPVWGYRSPTAFASPSEIRFFENIFSNVWSIFYILALLSICAAWKKDTGASTALLLLFMVTSFLAKWFPWVLEVLNSYLSRPFPNLVQRSLEWSQRTLGSVGWGIFLVGTVSALAQIPVLIMHCSKKNAVLCENRNLGTVGLYRKYVLSIVKELHRLPLNLLHFSLSVWLPLLIWAKLRAQNGVNSSAFNFFGLPDLRFPDLRPDFRYPNLFLILSLGLLSHNILRLAHEHGASLLEGKAKKYAVAIVSLSVSIMGLFIPAGVLLYLLLVALVKIAALLFMPGTRVALPASTQETCAMDTMTQLPELHMAGISFPDPGSGCGGATALTPERMEGISSTESGSGCGEGILPTESGSGCGGATAPTPELRMAGLFVRRVSLGADDLGEIRPFFDTLHAQDVPWLFFSYNSPSNMIWALDKKGAVLCLGFGDGTKRWGQTELKNPRWFFSLKESVILLNASRKAIVISRGDEEDLTSSEMILSRPPVAAAVNPFGSILAFAGEPERKLLLHYFPTNLERAPLQALTGVEALSFSPDNLFLYLLSVRREVLKINMATLGICESLAIPGMGSISRFAVGPDGVLIACRERDGREYLTVWNPTRDFFRERRMPVRVSTFAVDPCFGRIAIGGRKGKIVVYTKDLRKELLNLKLHEGAVTGLSFTPSGSDLISAAMDGTLVRLKLL